MQDILQTQQFLPFSLHQTCHRNAGPVRNYFGYFILGDLFPQKLLPPLFLVQGALLIFQGGFQSRQFGIFQLGGLLQIIRAFGLFDFAAGFFDLFTQTLDTLNCHLLRIVPGAHRVCPFPIAGQLAAQHFQSLPADRIFLLF